MAKRPPHEKPDNDEANADKPLSKAKAAEAMTRFKNVTRDLLKVSKNQLEVAQRAYEQRKVRKPGRPS